MEQCRSGNPSEGQKNAIIKAQQGSKDANNVAKAQAIRLGTDEFKKRPTIICPEPDCSNTFILSYEHKPGWRGLTVHSKGFHDADCDWLTWTPEERHGYVKEHADFKEEEKSKYFPGDNAEDKRLATPCPDCFKSFLLVQAQGIPVYCNLSQHARNHHRQDCKRSKLSLNEKRTYAKEHADYKGGEEACPYCDCAIVKASEGSR